MGYTFEDELIEAIDAENYAEHTESWEHESVAEEIRLESNNTYTRRVAVAPHMMTIHV